MAVPAACTPPGCRAGGALPAAGGRAARATPPPPGRPSRRRTRCRARCEVDRQAAGRVPVPGATTRAHSTGGTVAVEEFAARPARRSAPGLRGPREVGMPAQAGRHGPVVLVRERELELHAGRRQGDPLCGAIGPGPRTGRVDVLEARPRRPGLYRPSTGSGTVAVNGVPILRPARRPVDLVPTETETPVADPIRPGDQREAPHGPRVALGDRRASGAGRSSSIAGPGA